MQFNFSSCKAFWQAESEWKKFDLELICIYNSVQKGKKYFNSEKLLKTRSNCKTRVWKVMAHCLTASLAFFAYNRLIASFLSIDLLIFLSFLFFFLPSFLFANRIQTYKHRKASSNVNWIAKHIVSTSPKQVGVNSRHVWGGSKF